MAQQHGGPARPQAIAEELPAPEDIFLFQSNMRQISLAQLLAAAGMTPGSGGSAEDLEQRIASMQSAMDLQHGELQRQLDELRGQIARG